MADRDIQDQEAKAETESLAAGLRVAISPDTIVAIVAWQLQQLPQQMRSWLAQRKKGSERVVAHMIVERMTRRGIRFDAPDHDPDGSHCGYAGPGPD